MNQIFLSSASWKVTVRCSGLDKSTLKFSVARTHRHIINGTLGWGISSRLGRQGRKFGKVCSMISVQAYNEPLLLDQHVWRTRDLGMIFSSQSRSDYLDAWSTTEMSRPIHHHFAALVDNSLHKPLQLRIFEYFIKIQSSARHRRPGDRTSLFVSLIPGYVNRDLTVVVGQGTVKRCDVIFNREFNKVKSAL